jgi:diguanylate cyclase
MALTTKPRTRAFVLLRDRNGWIAALGWCAAAAVVAVGMETRLLTGRDALALVAVLLAGERAAANRRHRRELAAANRLANTDVLTGLANRRALLTALDDALRDTPTGPVGLVLVDLDDFKSVNDTYGHLAGDHVLRMVALRLRESMHPDALVARLGGDEFAVLVPGTGRHALPVLAAQAQTALARPVPVTGGHLTIGTSVGTASRGHDTRTATDLLQQADTTLYRAKTPRPATPPGKS